MSIQNNHFTDMLVHCKNKYRNRREILIQEIFVHFTSMYILWVLISLE